MRAAGVVLASLLPSIGAAQPPAPAAIISASFTVFLRAVPIGSEQVSLSQSAEGWTVSSSGRIGAPLDVAARRVLVRYDASWKPLELFVDATIRGQLFSLHTVVAGTTARSEVSSGAQTTQKSDTIAADAVLLPNPFFGPYEAFASRIHVAEPGTSIAAYAVPQAPVTIQVGESFPEQIQTPAELVVARRTQVVFEAAGNPLGAEIWTDAAGHLLRVTVPAQFLDVVREDIASVAARRVTISRPNDETVKIPANGFALAGTLSKPADAPKAPLPAIVLVAGSGPVDRDESVAGIPVFGQLAGALADAGFAVLRYDKRGIGQSGGRNDSASIADFAEDLKAAVQFLQERKDVDQRRIAVAGHSEGGSVALLTAAKDRRIDGVILIATNGISGSDLILAQQRHLLDRTKMTDAEKQAKIELQRQINDAVLSGKGLDALPPGVRRQVDNPEFQSLLAFDPAKVMPEVRQPILIVQGELDTQIEPSNADRLEVLSRARKNAPPVEVVKVPGVNHLLAPAATGEVDEYPSLKDKRISPAVAQAIASWMQKTLSPARTR